MSKWLIITFVIKHLFPCWLTQSESQRAYHPGPPRVPREPQAWLSLPKGEGAEPLHRASAKGPSRLPGQGLLTSQSASSALRHLFVSQKFTKKAMLFLLPGAGQKGKEHK